MTQQATNMAPVVYRGLRGGRRHRCPLLDHPARDEQSHAMP